MSRGISLRTFRKRYPMWIKNPDGTRSPTVHKIFLDAFKAAKNEADRQVAIDNYMTEGMKNL